MSWGIFPAGAELMALCDAALQGAGSVELQRNLIAPQAAAQRAARAERARAAAATKVEFFTMSREGGR